jgi:hypothetical protein
MTKKPRTLLDLAAQCRAIVLKAQEVLGDDLEGFSMLDLVADKIPDAPLNDLETALVVAGFSYRPRVHRNPVSIQRTDWK